MTQADVFGREAMKIPFKSLLRVRLAVVCLASVLLASTARAGVPVDAVVARVNGEAILFSDLKEAALDLDVDVDGLSMLRPNNEAFRAAITHLADEALLVQLAKREELAPDSLQISREVDRMIQTLKASAGGEEQMHDFLDQRAMTLEGLRDSLTRHETRQSLATAVVVRRIHIDGGSLGKFERDRRKSGEALVKYRVAQIFLECPRDEQKNEAGKALYQEAIGLLRKIGSNHERFLDTAQRRSGDPAAAQTRGVLGWIDPTQIDPALSKKLEQMLVGQISTPVTTSKGYHLLLKIDERTSRDLFFAEQFDEKRAELLRELRGEASIHIFDLEALRLQGEKKAAQTPAMVYKETHEESNAAPEESAPEAAP